MCLLLRPASHGLGDKIEKTDISRDVGANDGVCDAVQRDLGAFFLGEKRLLHTFPFDSET